MNSINPILESHKSPVSHKYSFLQQKSNLNCCRLHNGSGHMKMTSSKFRDISRDLVSSIILNNVAWSEKVFSETLSAKADLKNDYSISVVSADGLPPLGGRPSAGSVMVKCGSLLRPGRHLRSNNSFEFHNNNLCLVLQAGPSWQNNSDEINGLLPNGTIL